MLSEIIAMVSDYYFDRDNIFPSSSKVVLHTHWSPKRFKPEHSVYIMRDPINVCLSVMEYSKVRGFPLQSETALSAPKICRSSWLNHVKAAQSQGHHIVQYEPFIAGDRDEIARLATHLNVPADWVRKASELLNANHSGQPHESDTKFQQEKSTRTTEFVTQMRTKLEADIAQELTLYAEITRSV